ncbi:MAG: beta-ketoacyl-ACP synthase 3, partial [Rhodospirillaceae bacterium]|nr:beta-ketoacyl-ACP synthase 3 [Rhodospirillaceae bacterium]
MSIIRSRLIGVGAYLPERIVTNDELAKTVETSDAWIVERSGIRQRHIAAEGELTSDLATAAAREAMDAAGVGPDDIDLIVLGTTTPDDTFPATAAKVQANLGIAGGFAFDVQAVCSGFLYALSTADKFIRSGDVKTALVIGAETFSRLLDWSDRETCVLFGDGAGAVVLQASSGEGTNADSGILSTHLHSDGRFRDLLYVDGGPSRTQTVGF